jgi:hypothetical protein
VWCRTVYRRRGRADYRKQSRLQDIISLQRNQELQLPLEYPSARLPPYLGVLINVVISRFIYFSSCSICFSYSSYFFPKQLYS